MIKPALGIVLVELPNSNYGSVPFPEKSYDSVTYGTIVAVHPDDDQSLLGKTEYHRLFKDDCRVKGDNGEKQALIEIADIMGTSDANT